MTTLAWLSITVYSPSPPDADGLTIFLFCFKTGVLVGSEVPLFTDISSPSADEDDATLIEDWGVIVFFGRTPCEKKVNPHFIKLKGVREGAGGDVNAY